MAEKVSVLICTYKYGRFLSECLNSLMRQTRPPDEVIVVDDGSQDDTREVVKAFPDVRYLYQENAGKPVAMGRALALSTGDIVCHLDADDYWMPGKLARICEAFARQPSIGGVIHEVEHVDEAGRSLQLPYDVEPPRESAKLTLEGNEEVGFLYPLPRARGLYAGNPNTVCARRSAVTDLFPLPKGMGLCVDAVFLAGALRYGLLYLPDALSAYRHHGRNSWLGSSRAIQDIIDMWEFLLANENYRRHLTRRHASLLKAKILERKAYLASRTGDRKLEGLAAAVMLPFLLLRNGLLCNWKHLALPMLCVLPLKRSRRVLDGGNHSGRIAKAEAVR
jgi:glycosyltransferase involved in cell wall biosynthesis